MIEAMAELEGNLSIPGEKERFLKVAERIRDHIGADPVAREDLRENPVGTGVKKIALARLGRSATQVPKKKTPSEGDLMLNSVPGLDELMDPATRPLHDPASVSGSRDAGSGIDAVQWGPCLV